MVATKIGIAMLMMVVVTVKKMLYLRNNYGRLQSGQTRATLLSPSESKTETERLIDELIINMYMN